MRKILLFITLLAIILAGVLSIPYFSGGIFARLYAHVVDSSTHSSELPITTLKYQRGWFGSTIQSRIEIQDPIVRDTVVDFFPAYIEVHTQVRHGFTGVSSVSHLYPGGYNNPRHFLPHGQNILVHTQSNLNGRTTLEALIPPVTLTEQDDFSSFYFKSDTLHANLSLSPDFHTFEGNLSLASLFLMVDDELLEMQSLNIDFDQKKITDFLFSGRQQVTLERLILSGSEGEVITLEKLSSVFDAIPSGSDFLDFHLSLHAVSGSIDAMVAGPLNADFALRNLEIENLDNFFVNLDQALNQSGKSTHDIDLLDLLLMAMGDGVQFESAAFTLATPSGVLEGRFLLDIPPFDSDYFDLQQFSDEVKAYFTVAIPLPFMQSLDMEYGLLLNLLVAQGFIDLKDNRYHIDAQLEQGILFINGVPMPLSLPFGLR